MTIPRYSMLYRTYESNIGDRDLASAIKWLWEIEDDKTE